LQKWQQIAVEDIRFIVKGSVQLKVSTVTIWVDILRFSLTNFIPHRHCFLRRCIPAVSVSHHTAHQTNILRCQDYSVMIFKAGTDTCKYSGYFILSHNLSQQRIEPMQSLDDYNIIAGNDNLLFSAFQAAVCVKIKGWNDG